MMTKAFWLFTGIEAILLLVLLGMALADKGGGGDSGGRATGWAFFIVLPVIVLFTAIALFTLTPSVVPRSIALALVVAPLAGIVIVKTYNFVQIRRFEGMADGRRYFDDPKLQAMSRAIYEADAVKMAALAPEVDLNQQGRYDMTLLGLAQSQSQAGLIVEALLNEGADPNRRLTSGDPAYFPSISANNTEVLEVFLNHGANPNLALQRAAGLHLWPSVVKLLDHGADAGPIRAVVEKSSHEDAIEGAFAQVIERLKKP